MLGNFSEFLPLNPDFSSDYCNYRQIVFFRLFYGDFLPNIIQTSCFLHTIYCSVKFLSIALYRGFCYNIYK